MSITEFLFTWVMDCLGVALIWSGLVFWLLLARKGWQHLRRRFWMRRIGQAIRNHQDAGGI